MKKRTKRILALVLAFAMMMQQTSIGSAAAEPGTEPTSEISVVQETETETQVQATEPDTGDPAEDAVETAAPAETELQTEAQTDQATEAATGAVTEALTEAVTEPVSAEPETEPQTEKATEAQTETVAETAGAETETETGTEAETEIETETEAGPTFLSTSCEGVNISVTAEQGALEAGTVLEAVPVQTDAVKAAIEEKLADDEEVSKIVAFDLTLVLNGQEVQPNGKVQVSFDNISFAAEAQEEGSRLVIAHMPEDNGIATVSTIGGAAGGLEMTDGLKIETTHFSVFAVGLLKKYYDQLMSEGKESEAQKYEAYKDQEDLEGPYEKQNSFHYVDEENNFDFSSPAFDFHIFAEDVEFTQHTNGNIAANNLNAHGQAFGTNQNASGNFNIYDEHGNVVAQGTGDGVLEYNYFGNSVEGLSGTVAGGRTVLGSNVQWGLDNDGAVTVNGSGKHNGANFYQEQSDSENEKFLDVTEELNKLQKLSKNLAKKDSSEGITVSQNNSSGQFDYNAAIDIDISKCEQQINYLNVKATELLNNICDNPVIHITGAQNKTLIINVDMTGLTANEITRFANLQSTIDNFTNGEEVVRSNCNIMWNLYQTNATTKEIETFTTTGKNFDFSYWSDGKELTVDDYFRIGDGKGFMGTILAPDANIWYGAVNGSIIARKAHSNGNESHNWRFTGLSASITVKKVLEDPSDSSEKTFYFAVFDEYGRVPDQRIRSVTVKPGSSASVNFANLKPGKTYYIYEVDANGVRVESGPDGYYITGQGDVIIPDDGKTTNVEVTITNSKTKSEKGSLNIQKNVTINGNPTNGRKDADGTYKFEIKKDGETVKTVEITIQNGKSSTVTVSDLDPGKYVVHEVTPSENGATLTGGNDIEVTVSANDTAGVQTASFTNNKTKDEKGKLTVTKTVTAPEGTVTPKEYKITVTKDGKYYDEKGTASDAKVELTVPAGGSVTLNDLPVGTYTVTEVTPDAVSGYAWSVSVNGKDGDSGTVSIADEQEARTAITNTYTRIGSTKLTLKGTKALEGGELEGNDFTFHIQPAKDYGSDVTVPGNVKNNGEGVFTFGDLVFAKDGTYNFTVSEVLGSDTGIEYDTVTYAVEVVVKQSETDKTKYEITSVKVNGAVVTGTDGVYTLPNKDGKTTSFVNRVRKGSLTLIKTREIIPEDAVFPDDATTKFKFTVKDAYGFFYDEKGVAHRERVEITLDLTDKDGITIPDLPIGNYTVSEVKPATVDGFVWSVKVDGNEQRGDAYVIEVKDKEAASATITNTYKKIGEADLYLRGTKALANGTLANGKFKFQITQKSGTPTLDMPAIAQNAGGSFLLGPITFEEERQAGTYVFTVSEVPDEDDDSTEYDPATYDVTVTVEFIDGKLAITSVTCGGTALKKDGGAYKLPVHTKDGEEATFVNREKKGSLKIVKTVQVTPETDKEKVPKTFRFTVFSKKTGLYYDDKGNVSRSKLYVGVTEGAGTVLENLPIGDYIVTEYGDNGQEGYVWKVKAGDSEADNTTVTVADRKTQEADFTNIYTKLKDVTFALSGTKALLGGELAEGVYSFQMTQDAADSEKVLTDALTESNGADGSFTFKQVTFSKAGTYHFTVEEVDPKNEKIENDSTKYQVAVTVKAGEGDLEGQYVISSVTVDGKSVTGKNGVYPLPEKSEDGKKASFINRVRKGSLEITKTLEVVPATEGTANLPKEFTFTVQNDETKAYYKHDGSVAANEEDGQIKVTAGTTVTVSELPIGSYTVKETGTYEADGYVWEVTVDGKTAASATVTVKDKTAAEAAFTNTYTKIASVDFAVSGTKALLGGELKANAYYFWMAQHTSAGEKVEFAPLTAKVAEDGSFAFRNITFKKAGTYTFKVTEMKTPYDANIAYDGTIYTVIVKVEPGKGANAKNYVITGVTVNGKAVTPSEGNVYELPKRTETAAGETKSATFVNRVKKGSLKIIKTVEVSPQTESKEKLPKSFTFTVKSGNTFYNKDGKPAADEADRMITVPADGSVELKDLPIGVYEVTEITDPAPKAEGYVWKVTVNGDEKAAATVTVYDEETAEAKFTNAYTKIEGAKFGVSGTKALLGGELAEGDYSFQMTQIVKGSEPAVTVPAAVKNGADGSFTLDGITFEKPGTYTFEVKEVIPDPKDAGIVYDGTVYTVVVVVEQGKGELETKYLIDSVTITDAAGSTVPEGLNDVYPLPEKTVGAETASFINRQPKGQLQLTAKKQMKKEGAQLYTFSFELKDEDGKVLQTKSNDGKGEVNFDAIPYTLADVGTHVYTVNEVVTAQTTGDIPAGIVYDKTVYTVTVAVADDQNSDQLTVTKTVAAGDAEGKQDAEIIFTNDTTTVRFDKVDEDGGKLANAGLTVKDSAGTVVASWTTDGSVHELEGLLKTGETYTLEETAVPQGYAKAAPVTFTVDEDGQTLVGGVVKDIVEMVDLELHFHVNKTDMGTGEEVDGAVIEVVDENGNVVDSWTSKKGETHDFGSKLEAGKTYTVKETVAPEGYDYTTDVEFTVGEDGTITTQMPHTTDSEGNETYLVEDEKIHLHMNKVETGTGEEVDGAVIEVTDSNGNVVDSWTSKAGETHDFGSKLKAGESYTMRESVTPDGYLVASNIDFTVNKDGTITIDAKSTTDEAGNTVYLMEDDRKPESHLGSIAVRKSLALDIMGDRQPIAGTNNAVFYVALFKDAERTQRVTGVLPITFNGKSSTSTVVFDKLGAGTYYVSETYEDGTPLDDGMIDGVVFYPEYPQDQMVTLETDSSYAETAIDNVFYELPPGFNYIGELQITKEVLKKAAGGTVESYIPPEGQNVFYAGIFYDPEFTVPFVDANGASLVQIVVDGSNSSTVVVEVPVYNEDGSMTATYYVTETDEFGNPLALGTPNEGVNGLKYTVTVEGAQVSLTEENTLASVVITNTFEEEEEKESESESETQTETETEKQTETTPETTTTKAAKTGDETNYWLYLFLLLMSAGTVAVIMEERRRANKNRK